jgi:soluble lytic murein transglycosylase-like protein
MAILVALVLTVAVAWPSQASAQIYAWRDASGTLVLSDRRLEADATTYAVPDAPKLRTTRPAAPRDSYEPFEPLVQQYATRTGIRPDLVRAVIQVESAFNPHATSPKGAMGLMQLMPSTAREYNVRNPFEPKANIEAGIKHLKTLIDRFGSSIELGLAAYNAGPGAVERFNGIPPYRETRNYVSRILSLAGLK